MSKNSSKARIEALEGWLQSRPKKRYKRKKVKSKWDYMKEF